VCRSAHNRHRRSFAVRASIAISRFNASRTPPPPPSRLSVSRVKRSLGEDSVRGSRSSRAIAILRGRIGHAPRAAESRVRGRHNSRSIVFPVASAATATPPPSLTPRRSFPARDHVTRAEARASRASTSVTVGLLARGIVNGLQSAMRVEARRNDAMRGAARSSVLRGWPCARFPPSCSGLPPPLSLSLSLSPAPQESLENSVKVSSPRRVVSLWGFEGTVVSLSIPCRCMPPRLLTVCALLHLACLPPPSVTTSRTNALQPRNQTRNVRSDFENAPALFSPFG